jgi:adenosylcobyric acid synthase
VSFLFDGVRAIPMNAKAVMVLGTASGVGKSFLTAGLCRLFSDERFRVSPFKAQNMSNNSDVTETGGEMGRAQVVQAECARVTPSVDMNPILLKPSEDNLSQVVIHGKSIGHFSAHSFYDQKQMLWQAICQSYQKLKKENEVIVIEGAGSPAEVNLKENDLVNMKVAELADARCILVADIDRGGMFASVVGTLDLLEPRERDRIDGIVINKFRGDVSLVKDGVTFLEQKTGKKVLGILPFDRTIWLEEEDALVAEVRREEEFNPTTDLDIAVVLLPRMSNFTDFEIFKRDTRVRLRYVHHAHELGRPDLLILPGTKATVADYRYLQESGIHAAIVSYVNQGGHLLGICGGFQMLGNTIFDHKAVESCEKEVKAFGFLEVSTEFSEQKILRRIHETLEVNLFGSKVTGQVEGYEIHMGQTQFNAAYEKFGNNGLVHPTQKIAGTYFHGLFNDGSFRASFLKALAKSCAKQWVFKPCESLSELKEIQYNRLAHFLKEHLDTNAIRRMITSEVLS